MAYGFRVVRAKLVTDTSGYVSSTVPEPEALWTNAASFDQGDAVYKSIGGVHMLFYSAQDGNVGHDPEADDGTWWNAYGPTNRWAMFDTKLNTRTIADDSIEVVLNPPGRVDTLALMNLLGRAARVQMWDRHGALVFDRNFSLTSPSGITKLFAYFYEPIARKRDLIITNLRLFPDATLKVTLTAPGATVGIGALVVGFSKQIGRTKWGARLGIVDYSVKGADDFGNFEPVERSYSKRGSFELLVDPGYTDELNTFLADLRATPTLYIGNRDRTSTAIYGFFKEFEVQIPYKRLSLCSLDLEGLS